MTLDDFLTLLTQATLLLIAVLTIIDYLRHRGQGRLDTALLFGAFALNVILPSINSRLETESLWLAKANSIILMAHPYLLLRLVPHFRPVSKRIYWFAIGGLLLSTLLLITYTDTLSSLASLTLVAYFVIVELYSIIAFAQEARVTRGVTHYRLLLVAYGSAFLAALIFLAGITILEQAIGLSEAQLAGIQQVTDPLSQGLGVLAMLSYYAGFATPSRLRRAWQLTELHHFLTQAAGPWTGEPAQTTLERLSQTAVRATGGRAAVVSLWNEAEKRLHFQAASDPSLLDKIAPGKAIHHVWQERRPLILQFPADFPKEASPITLATGSSTMLSVPIRSHQRDWGLLTVVNWRTPLFASDDLALLQLLAEQTAVVLSYASLLDEQRLLVEQLQQRTGELEAAYQELEAFSYSVSHDLRAPLRHVSGYMQLLQKQVTGKLDDKGQHYFEVILEAATRMGHLIDDLLAFSRYSRAEMRYGQVDMDGLVHEVIAELQHEAAGRNVQWQIDKLPTISGDRALLRLVLVNLLANALKFTRPRSPSHIEIGYTTNQEEAAFFVRDNGVGFDMQFADKLFGVFQRLHSDPSLEGTGIGLANVRRIIQRHGGRVWAEGTVDYGATFYFTLPKGQPNGQGTLLKAKE